MYVIVPNCVRTRKFKTRRTRSNLGYSATKSINNATSYSTEQGNIPPPRPQGFERGIIRNLTTYFTV